MQLQLLMLQMGPDDFAAGVVVVAAGPICLEAVVVIAFVIAAALFADFLVVAVALVDVANVFAVANVVDVVFDFGGANVVSNFVVDSVTFAVVVAAVSIVVSLQSFRCTFNGPQMFHQISFNAIKRSKKS